MAVASRVIPLPVPRGTHGLSDRLLVERVAFGDDQAFEEILDRYGPALLSFCAHMLGSREWGEDALQLTFVAAYKALRRGQCDGALRPWLYAIARNRCLSELRARREIPDSDRVSAERPAIDDPASLFARREQLREVVEDIQRLPTDQRAALVLFELGDHSHEEIATVLGVRRDKVKALIFQAREGLYRGRSARESACSDVRELLANARGNPPVRGLVRAHVDRCAPCQEFEREVRRQRAALALVLPVALSGNLKALVLSSAVSHGSVGAGAAVGGAGSVAGATTAGSGSATLAGSGLGASAAATATGSGSVAVGGGAVAAAGSGAVSAAGSGAVSAAAGTAAPTMIASALGTEAVAGVGALTSSVSVTAVAKLATVVAVAVGVGVGGVTGSALTPSPRPQVSLLAGQPAQPAPLRSPLQPLGSGMADPLASATDPGSQPGAGATAPAARPPTDAASALIPSSIAAPSSSAANPAAVSGPTPPTGTTSAPAASAPGDGSATTTAPSSASSTTTATITTAPSSASSTTTATTTTTTASSPTGSGRSTSTTTTASSPTTTAGSSSGSSAGQSSGGNPGGGVTNSNGNGPPVTPPGCVNNPAPGCTTKAPRP